MVKYIDSKNFDENFKKLLKLKKGRNIAKGRYDIESIELSAKSTFIIQFILSFKVILGVTYKVLFWEKNERIESLFKSNYQDGSYEMTKDYQNGKLPGIIYGDSRVVDKHFLRTLLDNHFNYEMTISPSLNLRVQICINVEDFIVLLDIYDDRGFDIYYLGSPNSASL